MASHSRHRLLSNTAPERTVRGDLDPPLLFRPLAFGLPTDSVLRFMVMGSGAAILTLAIFRTIYQVDSGSKS